MRIAVLLLCLGLAACATTTSVVLLDPARKFPPTESVQILLKPPQRPHIEIAKLESRGVPGEPETSVLEDARERARQIGADAIVVQESMAIYYPPVVVYDPWPPYRPWYYDRWYAVPYWYYPAPFMYGPVVHTLPGGHAYTVRSIAIKFTSPEAETPQPGK